LTSPELKTGDVPDALNKLTMETSAELVQIWQVDLPSDSQWFLGARRHDGERPVFIAPSFAKFSIIHRISAGWSMCLRAIRSVSTCL
jgi:hypothetical protein